MKKTSRQGRVVTLVVVALAVVLLVFIAAFWYVNDRYFSPYVTVTVRNADSVPIDSVTLEHEHGSEVVRDLQPGASKEIRFDTGGGESSYKLEVRFRGGQVVSGGNYVEPSYRIIQVATRKGVKTEKYF